MTARRVLVVDDDDSIREVTSMALEVVGGWAVTTAASGPEALSAARETPLDAVLLDVMMPGMDGVETFTRLQADEQTRGIPVVLLTAKVQVGDRQVWDGLAVAGAISKPFDPLTLPAQVSRLLGWKGG